MAHALERPIRLPIVKSVTAIDRRIGVANPAFPNPSHGSTSSNACGTMSRKNSQKTTTCAAVFSTTVPIDGSPPVRGNVAAQAIRKGVVSVGSMSPAPSHKLRSASHNPIARTPA